MLWSFVHNHVKEKLIYSLGNSPEFEFIIHVNSPQTLFWQLQVIESVNVTEWAFLAHEKAIQYNCPNYSSARIKVPTELKIDNWRSLCGNYVDQVLLDCLEYRFPLCVDRTQFIYNTEVDNHPSAQQYPEDIEAYYGPYTTWALSELTTMFMIALPSLLNTHLWTIL